jgi:hypothetical protein
MINRYQEANYYSHELNISMKTSSGDVIEMDFLNQKASSIAYAKNNKSENLTMSFSSKQAFHFSVDSNGIDAQDKKEIAAFMKKAQPLIDKFLQEFEKDAPNTPVSKLAHQIAAAFEPNQNNTENKNNFIKTNIVKAFDKSAEKLPEIQQTDASIEKSLKELQKLLERTLKEFDDFYKKTYA